jgi:hypothetical protein
MNERLTTAGGVLIALLLVVGLFVQQPPESPISLPTSVESGPNGYLGLVRWLEGAGVAVASSRLRFDQLSEISALGSVLIITAPHQRRIRSDEFEPLRKWVESGNTLLVLAALDDTPDWSLVADTSTFITDLERLTGTTFEAATPETVTLETATIGTASSPEEVSNENATQDPGYTETDAMDADNVGADTIEEGELLMLGEVGKTTKSHFIPALIDHPLTRNIEELTAWSDSTASIWRPTIESPSPGRGFLTEPTSSLAAAWTRAQGSGYIITIAAGSIFNNRALGEADNRILLANLVRWHLRGDGKVIFDDLHQGLSKLYDPEAFFSDSRVGISVLFILVFWFVYMIGTQNRMIPVQYPRQVPRQGNFVRAMGGFLARKLQVNSAAKLMFDRWFDALKSDGALQESESPWSYLEASPLVDAQNLARLQRIYRQVEAGEKVDLEQLHNYIHRIREALG